MIRPQLLLGQNKLESTVRYLGIKLEDALEIANRGLRSHWRLRNQFAGDLR